MQYPDFYSQGPTPCSTTDPDAFFPDQEIPGSVKRAENAKKLCGDCPYKAACLAWALENNEMGIWGGTTGRQRGRMKQSRVKGSTRTAILVRSRAENPM